MQPLTVQACGCIALPEEIQKASGLYPGAIFRLDVSEDGACVSLHVLEPTQPTAPVSQAQCSTSSASLL